MLKIISPIGEVFPYIDEAKKYLQAGAGVNVADYLIAVDNQYAPVRVLWQYNGERAYGFIIEYARKADFTDAIALKTDGDINCVDL